MLAGIGNLNKKISEALKMSLETRSVKELKDIAINAVEAQINQETPAQTKSFTRVISGVFAALTKIANNLLVLGLRESFPQTATERALGGNLEDWGVIADRARKPASASQLECGITGTNGITIPTGAGAPRLVDDLGQVYVVIASDTISGGIANIVVEATFGGVSGNLQNGATLIFTSPIVGVDSIATVQQSLILGQPAESVSDYQAIITQLIARPSGCSNVAQYFKWTTEVPNIIDAFPYSASVPGRILIYCVASDQPDGIPTNAELQEVEDYLNAPNREALYASDVLPDSSKRLNVLASLVDSYFVLITGLQPDDSNLKNSIDEALTDYFLTRKPNVPGLSLRTLNIVSVNALIAVVQDVIDASDIGISFAGLTLSVGTEGVTGDNFVLPSGTRAKLGGVVYE